MLVIGISGNFLKAQILKRKKKQAQTMHIYMTQRREKAKVQEFLKRKPFGQFLYKFQHGCNLS